MFEYNREFYQWIIEHTKEDINTIVPYLINKFNPKSIVDFGCGTGLWLKKVKELCPEVRVLGIDGFYVNEKDLEIEYGEFIAADLTKKIELD